MSAGRETIKFLAALGSGTLTALTVGLLVEVFTLDPTSTLGAAIAAAVGTALVRFVGWATAKYGPAPVVVKPTASRTRKRKTLDATPLRPEEVGFKPGDSESGA